MMKDTTIIYNSIVEKFEKLDDAQFGKLMRAALKYSSTGEVPELDDVIVSLAFDFIKVDIDANNAKYQKVCEKRRQAGAKGGLAKASKSKQELANASNSYQELASDSKASKSKQELANVAKLADTDSESDSDSESEFIYDKQKRERREKKSNDFSPPTPDEVFDYCLNNQIAIDTDEFFNHYASQDWLKANGMPITNWKACVRSWAKKENKFPRLDKSVVEKAIDYQIKDFAIADSG